ncbi:MAG: hypothetical protein WCJ35_16615 [Planctomycetota bacterium]
MSLEPIIEKMNTNRWEKWLAVFQTIALMVILPWATWVTSQIFQHDGRVMMVEKWQESRPKFVTSSEQEAALLRSQETLRKEHDDLFHEIQIRLDKLLEKQQEIRLEIIKHTARKP